VLGQDILKPRSRSASGGLARRGDHHPPLARVVAGDLVAEVELLDDVVDPVGRPVLAGVVVDLGEVTLAGVQRVDQRLVLARAKLPEDADEDLVERTRILLRIRDFDGGLPPTNYAASKVVRSARFRTPRASSRIRVRPLGTWPFSTMS
jgi:hypothetical protein